MPVAPSRIPEPPRTDPLRVLAGLALVALTFAALSVGLLACQAQGTIDDLDRLADDAETAVDDVNRAARRVDRDARQLDPTLDELRRAARALREIRAGIR